MIATLTGHITHKTPNTIIIEVKGVGYLVHCPNDVISSLPITTLDQNQQPTTLYIHTHVREDQLTLFGFATQADVGIFQQLITVSGIGPKIGLNILNNHSASEIANAITHAKVDFFTAISGIGKKGAQKIIVELKSKLGSLAELDLDQPDSGSDNELSTALIGLGFKPNEARQAAQQVPSDITQLEDQIRHVLQTINK